MYFVYILQCSDNTYYTGYTDSLYKRIKAHNDGKGAKYTRGRIPVELVYQEQIDTKSNALKREAAIKKLTRVQKKKLINENREKVG